MHSAAGKLEVAGNGLGIIVGGMQQYRKRWGFVRMASSRVAWPHKLHGKQQQQQQREKSRRDQVLGVSSAGPFLFRQHIAGVGHRSGGWVFRANGWFVFTMDAPINRFFSIKLFEVYYFCPE